MLSVHWEELQAQVESHGAEKVVFYLTETNEPLEINIYDIRWEDGEVKVVFE